MTTHDDGRHAIERVASAHRPEHPTEVAFHPAFLDLGEDARRRAHVLASDLRQVEAAADPRGLSTTAHAVLRRLGLALEP
jgi:hypothetical protein